MKKILLEYANIIGYTITGLVFGLGFFLLFINAWHNSIAFSSFRVTSGAKNLKYS